MKLSVFVVTYNQERFIEQCLSSIVSQVVDFDYEVIVGDDCSTDGTAAICDSFAEKFPNIRVFHHPQNLGHVKNWEFVLNHCEGEYVAMVEGDDYWTDPNKIQTQVDFLDQHKDFSLSFHKVNLCIMSNPTGRSIYLSIWKNVNTMPVRSMKPGAC